MFSLLKKLLGGNKDTVTTPTTECVPEVQAVKKPASKPAVKKPRATAKKKSSSPRQ